MNNTILKMTNINKQFSGVHALKGVDFNLRKGEVHALMGENGAGKSTLMKILTGIYKADSGEIFVFNDKCDFDSVKDSQEKGIAIIHQELNLIPDLTVAQNIFLGREKMISKIFIDDKKMEKEAEKEETKSKPIPGIYGLILFVIICLGYSVCNAIDITEGIISSTYGQEHFLKVVIPDCINILTLLTCSILIAIIAYNVIKKKISHLPMPD